MLKITSLRNPLRRIRQSEMILQIRCRMIPSMDVVVVEDICYVAVTTSSGVKLMDSVMMEVAWRLRVRKMVS